MDGKTHKSGLGNSLGRVERLHEESEASSRSWAEGV